MSERKYLITGASGFLGSTILKELRKYDHTVWSLSRYAGEITADLGQQVPVLPCAYDIIIHAAGKAHSIPKTKSEEATFYQVNHQGTLNLLKGLEKLHQLPNQFIFISTVAVYGRDEGEDIDEDHPLKGDTPYAKSKIMAEKTVSRWCREHRVPCLILRLPLIVGANPPGNLGKLIAAISSGRYLKIKNNPARKSAVLARDIAEGIPRFQGKSGTFNLTDGQHPYFGEIEDAIAKGLSTTIKIKIPLGAILWLAKLGDLVCKLNIPFPLTSLRLAKMTQTLTFSDQRAQTDLDWSPTAVVPFLQNPNILKKQKTNITSAANPINR